LKLYVDLVNAQGGLLGRRLSLIQYDVGIAPAPRRQPSAA
jgi:ABC-type branched-subunit amino acid transport system substrate-binding protein